MTMIPMWKKCTKCHKKYDWNPDIGHFICPYCHGLGKPSGSILRKALYKRKDSQEENYSEAEAPETEN